MENTLKLQKEYNTLDSLYNALKSGASFECSKEYDTWEHRIDANGQMEQCIVLKKSAMHAVKIYFTQDNMVKINHIIPSAVMHAYFGKSLKARKDIIEIITGKIKEILLAPAQQKAFKELEAAIAKVAA